LKTGYPALDERIAKSKDKKSELIMVLKHPELPLHNNDAELGARAQVRKRDVSLHTMTKDGTKGTIDFSSDIGINIIPHHFFFLQENFRRTK